MCVIVFQNLKKQTHTQNFPTSPFLQGGSWRSNCWKPFLEWCAVLSPGTSWPKLGRFLCCVVHISRFDIYMKHCIACHKYTNNKTSFVLSGLLSSLQKIFGDLHFSESFVKERVVNFDKQIHLCGSRSFGCFSITRGRRQRGVVRKSRMDANSRNDTQPRFIVYCWKFNIFSSGFMQRSSEPSCS